MTRSSFRSSFLESINCCAMLFYKTKPRDFDLSLLHTKTSCAVTGTGDRETVAEVGSELYRSKPILWGFLAGNTHFVLRTAPNDLLTPWKSDYSPSNGSRGRANLYVVHLKIFSPSLVSYIRKILYLYKTIVFMVIDFAQSVI